MVKCPVGSDTDSDTDGFTLAGMAQLIVFVAVPMLVLPLYVVRVNTIDTDVPVVFCRASISGGMNEMLVAVVFELTEPCALPHLYVIVCVKLLSALSIVNVCAVPSVPFDAVRLLALGIVSSVPLPDPDFVPSETPLNVMPEND